MDFDVAKHILGLSIDQWKKDILNHSGVPSRPDHACVQKYDIRDPVTGATASIVVYGLVTENEKLASGRRIELQEFVDGVASPPSDPILTFLVAQSHLRTLAFDFKMLEAYRIYLSENLLIDSTRIKTDVPAFSRVFVPLRDLLEKLGLLLRASADIRRAPPGFGLLKVKTAFYMFIWATKALLDSLAVFLKQQYDLSEQGGKIDLGKGEPGRTGFLASLSKKNAQLASSLATDFRAWIASVQKYRDETIHKKGVLLVPTEDGHYKVPKDSTLDPLLAERMEPAEVGKHLIVIESFADEWLNNAMSLTNRVLAAATDTLSSPGLSGSADKKST